MRKTHLARAEPPREEMAAMAISASSRWALEQLRAMLTGQQGHALVPVATNIDSEQGLHSWTDDLVSNSGHSVGFCVG